MNSALAHGGLPEGVKPYQLIALVKQVSRSTAKFDRISRTAVSLLEYCISCCRDGDFHRGKICGAWEQPGTIAVKLGISTRVLHNAEAELREKNLIERTSVAHARRQGLRRNGEIVSLAGISLRPLIDGYGKLVAIRDAMQMQQDAVSSLKNEICQLRRRIRETGDVHLAEEADEILPGGRTSRITQTDRLEAIKGDLEALLVFIDVRSGEHKSSDRTEENFAPIILEEDSFKNRSGVGRGAPIETAFVTPVMAANLASEDYQALLAARGGPSWPNLVETSATASSWLGISQQVWGEACQTMGRERAAICMLVIDRNWRLPVGHRYRAKSPRHCLMGMAKQTRAGEFNLFGLVRAVEAHPAEGPTSAVPQFERPEQDAFTFAAKKGLARILSRQAGDQS